MQNLLLVLFQSTRRWNSIICIFLHSENDLQCAAISKSSKTSLTRLIEDHHTLLQSALLDTDAILLPKMHVIRSGALAASGSHCQSRSSYIYGYSLPDGILWQLVGIGHSPLPPYPWVHLFLYQVRTSFAASPSTPLPWCRWHSFSWPLLYTQGSYN